MKRLDTAIAAVVGALVLAGVWLGAGRAAVPETRSAALDQALSVHAGVDPLMPPGMPAGARIDPKTGILVLPDLRAGDGEIAVPWEVLAPASQITRAEDLPASIRALDGKRVVLAGFVMALYELRAMREFALVGSHYTCCFGTPPGFGEQIKVALRAGQGGLDATPAPVRVAGRLEIHPEHLFENGRGPLISLFRITEAEVVPYDG